MRSADIVVIGGGPAGLAAAAAAYDAGCQSVIVLERDARPGGILNQCIHNGFGLHRFREELTGPEYAARYVAEVERRGIPVLCGTMVLRVGADRSVAAVSPDEGVFTLRPAAVVLACGCRERPRGAINIAGTRPAGVYSAGTAQKLVNIDGVLPGKEVVILGSGDIGLIMARRMTFEGAHVAAVAELMPYSSGLNRNIVQCLNDFNIPLLFSHTVVRVHGRERLTGVTLARVDEARKPIPESEKYYPCDTLLLSVGLLPENELAKGAGIPLSPVTGGAVVDDAMMTERAGVFACGNALHVHDLVDYVSEEAEEAGRAAAAYAAGAGKEEAYCETEAAGGVRYVVPQRVRRSGGGVTLKLRVDNVYENAALALYVDGARVALKKRRVMAPGEMEMWKLGAAESAALRNGTRAVVRLEGRP